MNKILKTIFLSLLIFTAFRVEAASLEVSVNSNRTNINAIEGVVIIPQGMNVKTIETGHSAILVWIQSPVLDTKTNTISFSGISPGGFQGTRPLFVLSGDFNDSVIPKIQFGQVRALKGDGSGSEVPVTLKVESSQNLTDTDPPEDFTPIIGSSQELFGGEPFVTFLAQDKGSGIEKYRYTSTWLMTPGEGDWVEAVAPLQLSKMDLFKVIYVRAEDKSGNERIGKVYGTYYYATILFGTIIILCAFYIVRRLFVRSS